MNRPSRFLFALAGAALLAAPAFLRAEAPEPPAAIVAGSTVSMSEVDQAAADRLRRLRDDEYAIKRQVLEDFVFQALIEKEAAARGVTAEALTQAEVEAKAQAPSDAQVKEFYGQNKSRMGDKSYEELSSIIQNYLRQQNVTVRQAAYARALKARYGMRLFLEPPRTAVDASSSPSKGPKNAPVTVIEFSDYQCPFCSKAEESVKRIGALYGNSVRLVFRNFPLSIHKDAPRAAEAAGCAEAQGKFWPLHDLLFANQDKLSDDGVTALAAKAGLKKDAFAKCLASGAQTARWQKDADEGRRAGVTGTPTFFVNGRMLFGNIPYEALVQAVDDELLRAGKPLPGAVDAPVKGKRK